MVPSFYHQLVLKLWYDTRYHKNFHVLIIENLCDQYNYLSDCHTNDPFAFNTILIGPCGIPLDLLYQAL